MNQQQVDKINSEKRKRIAVAYLVQHPEECNNDVVKSMIGRLRDYEKRLESLNKTINEMQNRMNQLGTEGEQMIGSVTALVDVTADMIDDDSALQFCLKFEPPEKRNRVKMSPAVTANQPISHEQKSDVDIAGSTARKQ